MAHRPHIELPADGTPVEVTAGLPEGRYVAQVRANRGERAVLYASGASAPADDLDYFEARGTWLIDFEVADRFEPLWAKTATDTAQTLAVADQP